jgi:large subunit GTPase 1
MTAEELEKNERSAFLDWRRKLAQLHDDEEFVLTPFERNLEVWRQLWRVIERSDIVVQIVDGRNPLQFWCEDLDRYVQELVLSGLDNTTSQRTRKSLLLINKSDLLTSSQR